MTREEAEFLARFEGDDLCLDGLEELTEDEAFGLTGMKANMTLLGINLISEDALSILAGLTIRINGYPAAEWVSRQFN